jgi:hypothetical protein
MLISYTMKNKKLFQKIVFIALIALILFSLVAPAIFSQTLTAPKQEKLLNGLKVLMWPNAKDGKVHVKIRIHAGSAFDPQGKEGVMQILADNIFPNEASRDFFAEDLGGGLEIVSNYDYIEISASSKPESLVTMIETLSAAVSNPAIDKEQTIKLRAALSAKVAAWEADPAYVADQAVSNRLLGTFPYGRPEDGSTVSLQKIDFADLIDAKSRFLTADNATIAIWGNFDRELAFRAIRRYFGSWLKSDRKVPATFRQPDEAPVTVLNVLSPKPETAPVRLAFRGVARNDKDFAASVIFASILENRLKAGSFSDLFVRNDAHVLPGIIVIGFSAGNIELVTRALAGPVTDAEFQTAKDTFQARWAKTDAPTFWLDADTFKLTSADADARAANNITLADVNTYAEKVRKLPLATVRLTNPTAK